MSAKDFNKVAEARALFPDAEGVERDSDSGFAGPQPEDEESPILRLRRWGPRSLSTTEVLSLILPEERETVGKILQEIGLTGLAMLDERYFFNSGLDERSTAALLAAVELSRRLARDRIPDRLLMNEPEAVASYLALRYQGDQEVFGGLFLDARQRLIMERELYRGTLTRASVEPRGVLKTALLCDAYSVVVFHTHPSGDPAPSQDDLDMTHRLADAAQVVGVKLDDHIILGLGGQWVSLKARGAI